MTPKEKIVLLKEVLGSRYPNPKSELNYENPFQLLIATILAAQSTDRQVNVITRELFKVAPDANSLSRMELDEVKNLVRSINYFNNKAKNILEVSRILVNEYEGRVPDRRAALESLPGVGRKTANVVLSNAFRQPVMPVDTHVHRVSNRIGVVKTGKVEETETELMKIIPEAWVIDFHHYLLLHGRYTCKAKKPECQNCPLSFVCDYAQLHS
ncbi:endonuclease III [Chlorobium ferrooxidans]|uniref:Endonuclease III n=1 Tax=Chlorobium ferrooxidans DSM 13031 TaxID=377431 RepID=Q0YTQ0_9CHLB|nr:endonuclease III [Chlorobium ferrooxidans]EAT59850.1 endonuclease III [Chlorobium ferrooxidans DSM 13031]